MIFIEPKTKYVFVLFFVFFFSIRTYCQNNSEIPFYTKFDSIVGKENLGLVNGAIALSQYRTIGENNMFLKNNKFTYGNLIYDGQPYYNAKLKYDIFKDQLILNPPGSPEHIGINLIQDKTTSFSIYDKNFLKINKSQTSLPEFETGYYEIIKIDKKFNLYIKHHKDIQKEVNEEGVYYSFHEKNQYYIELNDLFYIINTKSEIIKIFPKCKKTINTFFQKNRSLSKTDTNLFMNSLMIAINDSSISNSKQ